MVPGILLASGYGRRLRSVSNIPKYFIELDGYPLIYFPLYSMYRAGVSPVTLVLNNETYSFYLEYQDFFKDFELSILINPKPELDNGYTLLYSLWKVDAYPVVVSVGDHVYPYLLIERLLRCMDEYGDADFLVAGDSSPMYVDVEEATKILCTNGVIKRLGKDLTEYSYIDTGVFLFTEKFRDYIDISLERRFSISDFLNNVVEEGGLGRVCPVENIPWRDVDTPEDYVVLSKDLFNSVFKPYFN